MSADTIFTYERVRVTQPLPGAPDEQPIPVGSVGTVQRERWHVILRRCYVVRFELDGRKVFAFVPVNAVESVERVINEVIDDERR